MAEPWRPALFVQQQWTFQTPALLLAQQKALASCCRVGALQAWLACWLQGGKASLPVKVAASLHRRKGLE